jgi:anti-anti-sigma factor
MEGLGTDGDPTMDFEISSSDEVATLRLTGELDIANVDELEQAVSSVIEQQPTHLVVDVGGLRFADSSAIAMWVRWAVTVPKFELRDPSPVLRKVIAAMGLSGVLGLSS